MSKELLFSVTKDDCEWSYTKGTGKGGQKRNKTSSAVHCFHKPSGAHGYSESSRKQIDNKRDAFKKMVDTQEFKLWQQHEIWKKVGVLEEVEKRVEEEMKNIKIETVVDGKWTEEHDNR